MSHNRSLTRMHLEYFDFSRARLELLHQFVIENDNLSDLGLHACGLSVEDIQRLANAFGRRRNPASITAIALRVEITDGPVPAIVELCNHCPRLQKLELSYSDIGNQACNELALLLETPESKLKCLILNGNFAIGDDGAEFLANAIINNKKLKRLELSRCSELQTGVGIISSDLYVTQQVSMLQSINLTTHLRDYGCNLMMTLCLSIWCHTKIYHSVWEQT